MHDFENWRSQRNTRMGDKTCYIGIDEAGRGSLIGDMLVACVMVSENTIDEIARSGLNESKQLDGRERARLYELALRRGVTAVVVYVPPWRIDRENMNKIEEDAIAWIMKVIGSLVCSMESTVLRVYIDEVKGRERQVESIVRKQLGSKLVEIKIEPHADANYAPTALASIFAKVLRDRSLEPLRELGGDFGSGYPSDPKLESWLKSVSRSHSNPPRYIRRSWSNLRDIAPEWYREKKIRKHKSLLDFAKR